MTDPAALALFVIAVVGISLSLGARKIGAGGVSIELASAVSAAAEAAAKSADAALTVVSARAAAAATATNTVQVFGGARAEGDTTVSHPELAVTAAFLTACLGLVRSTQEEASGIRKVVVLVYDEARNGVIRHDDPKSEDVDVDDEPYHTVIRRAQQASVPAGVDQDVDRFIGLELGEVAVMVPVRSPGNRTLGALVGICEPKDRDVVAAALAKRIPTAVSFIARLLTAPAAGLPITNEGGTEVP